jgi:hypothetical protein
MMWLIRMGLALLGLHWITYYLTASFQSTFLLKWLYYPSLGASFFCAIMGVVFLKIRFYQKLLSIGGLTIIYYSLLVSPSWLTYSHPGREAIVPDYDKIVLALGLLSLIVAVGFSFLKTGKGTEEGVERLK